MNTRFGQNIYKQLLDLATEEGINASGKHEIFGCIFGRDSAVTILKILKAISNNTAKAQMLDRTNLLKICKRSLLKMAELQGKNFNIESGEEPGKFIHEYRKEKFEHLVNRKKPWFVYPEGVLKNYDSIDVTPLMLIAIYRYFELTNDSDFLKKILISVERGLEWIIKCGDLDGDNLLEYQVHKGRKFGGLVVQSWTDSWESITQKDGSFPKYPIAPVEVQGYAWLALKLWSDFFGHRCNGYYSLKKSKKLKKQANAIKKTFNKKFLFKENCDFYLAQALDGNKQQIKTVTGNPLLVLWASHNNRGEIECILKKTYVAKIVARAFHSDMFETDAGLRTMSTLSPTFNPNQNCYHNGSFWPKLNGMVHEGLQIWGFRKKADSLKNATLKPVRHFDTPIELYVKTKDGNYAEFKTPTGQMSCRVQAWSAAAVLDLLTL